jgi:hypothetical protein
LKRIFTLDGKELEFELNEIFKRESQSGMFHKKYEKYLRKIYMLLI